MSRIWKWSLSMYEKAWHLVNINSVSDRFTFLHYWQFFRGDWWFFFFDAHYMGVIDLINMLHFMCSFSFICNRWYAYLFVYMIYLAARNACIYCCHCCNVIGEQLMLLFNFLMTSDLVGCVQKSPKNSFQTSANLQAPASLQAASSSMNQCTRLPLPLYYNAKCVVCTKLHQHLKQRFCVRFVESHCASIPTIIIRRWQLRV